MSSTIVAQINALLILMHRLKKITKFTDYITFVIDNPYLPPFVEFRMNNNPEFVMKLLKKQDKEN
jgi:hypothetical protein